MNDYAIHLLEEVLLYIPEGAILLRGKINRALTVLKEQEPVQTLNPDHFPDQEDFPLNCGKSHISLYPKFCSVCVDEWFQAQEIKTSFNTIV